jgi:hypothetical protein
MTDGAPQPVRLWNRYAWWVLAPVAVLLGLSWTNDSTDVTPGHSDFVLSVALGAAVVAALSTAVAIFWKKPKLNGPRFLAIPALVLCAAVMAGLVAMGATDRLVQLVVFSGHVSRSERVIPIERAYVSHGKGAHHEVQLGDPFAEFSVPPDDYEAAFGASEDLNTSGYCLTAVVETKGQAMRIMLPQTHNIPPGHIRRCPSP